MMLRATTPEPTLWRALRTPALLLVVAAAACGGGMAGPGPSTAPVDAASDAVWRSLATPRAASLSGAVHLSVGEIQLPTEVPWDVESTVPLALGFTELVNAGLLRRADVRFVERRRFAAAVDAERRGQARAAGAPPTGTSAVPDFILEGQWARVGSTVSALELRLVDPQSGAVAHSWRHEVPAAADPVGLSRAVVGSVMNRLESVGRRPVWTDPESSAAPNGFVASAVPAPAVDSFLSGLAAEERWDWEGARVGYQEALREAPSFFEARAALARTARLRTGGSLAGS